MNTIDKIRAEIERLMKEIRGYDDWTLGFESACERILNAIDTMPDEEPVSEDVNDEIKRYIEEYGYERGEDKLLIAIVARHFAEWGAEHTPLPEDTVIFQKGVAEGIRLEREDALTIDDIEKLHTFLYAVKNNKQGAFTFTRLSDEQYEEVLRRFNKTKEDRE